LLLAVGHMRAHACEARGAVLCCPVLWTWRGVTWTWRDVT
jgi:hypothetical protein